MISPTGPTRRPFTSVTFREWCTNTPDDASSIKLDLASVTFIDPLGLAVVAAVAEKAAADGLAIDFVPPRADDVCRYMSRMHLDECLNGFGSDADLPNVNERNTGHRLFELQRFDEDSNDEFAARVFQAVRAQKGENDAKSFYKGICEVLNNVIEHSGVKGGWAAMQVMPQRKDLISFAVADAGAGLESTLSRYHKIDGPVDAMCKAFEPSVSGTGAHGRGAGLDDLLRRVGRHRGNLQAWSGFATGHNSGSRMACHQVGAAFPGTLIYAEFRPEPEIKLREVWR